MTPRLEYSTTVKNLSWKFLEWYYPHVCSLWLFSNPAPAYSPEIDIVSHFILCPRHIICLTIRTEDLIRLCREISVLERLERQICCCRARTLTLLKSFESLVYSGPVFCNAVNLCLSFIRTGGKFSVMARTKQLNLQPLPYLPNPFQQCAVIYCFTVIWWQTVWLRLH